MARTSTLLFAGLLIIACGRRDDARDRPATGSPPAAASAPPGEPAAPPPVTTAGTPQATPPVGDGASVDASPERGGADDPLAEKLRHCPLTVPGVTAVLVDVSDGVAWTITAPVTSDAGPAPDPAVIAEIRRRAAHLVEFTDGQAEAREHGGGDGGGFMRNCPVVARDTRITATDIPGGSRIVVRPVHGLTAAALRTESRRRHDALTAP